MSRSRHPAPAWPAGLLCALLAALLLSGCGGAGKGQPAGGGANPEPEAAADAGLAPVTELTFPDGSICPVEAERVDLSRLRHDGVEEAAALLRQMPRLREVELGAEDGFSEAEAAESAESEVNEAEVGESEAETKPARADAGETGIIPGTEPKESADVAVSQRRNLTWEDVRTLQEACPDADLCYRFALFGKNFSTLDTEMDFRHVEMDDEGAAVREVLPCMTKCKLLDMDFTGVSSEKMAEIRDAWPEMKVVWRIWFGNDCSVRTDVERILASNLNHVLSDENSADLKYCTCVRFLDVGHNTLLTDFSFLSQMPDLEVAIVAITGLHDLSPLANHEKLEYLEINTCAQGMDLSPLGSCPNLEHLCATFLGDVQGWEALKNLKKLQRLWFGCYTHLPEGALEELQEALPDTVINTTNPYGDGGDWRYEGHHLHPRYALLKEQFEYSNYNNVCSSWYNDPLYYKEGEPHYRPRW